MYAKHVKLKGYRSFKKEQVLELSYPGRDGKKYGLNVLVGPSSSGKTSILKLFQNRGYGLDTDEVRSNASIEFSDVAGNRQVTKYSSLSTEATTQLIPEGIGPQFMPLILPYQRQLYFSTTNPSSGYVPSDSNPRSLIFHTASSLSSHFSISQKLNDDTIASTLASCLDKPGVSEILMSKVRELIPGFGNLRVIRSGNSKSIRYVFPNSTTTIDANNLSDGTKFIIGLCLYIVIYDADLSGLNHTPPPNILVIDEPELGLFPQVQKKVFAILQKISENTQVIYATHSPYFLDWFALLDGARIFRTNVRRKIAEVRELNVSDDVIKVLKTQPRLLNQYDLVSREIFFAEKIVFVEGQEDANILRNYIVKNGIEFSWEFYGYGVGGADRAASFVRIAKNLGIQCAAIFDANVETGTRQECIDLLGKDAVKVWSADDIRDKPDKKTPISGIFDVAGVAPKSEQLNTEVLGLLQEIESL